MTYYAISALINFSVGLFFGFFVLYKNYWARINRSLFFWCLTVASWSFFYFVWQIEAQGDRALLWTRLLMVGAVWVPIAYFRVVVIFLGIEKKYKKFIYANYALAALFTALLATPLMVARVEPTLGFPFWPQPGLAYTPFLAMFLGLSAYAACLSWRAMHTEQSAIKRAQIKYMLLGIAISIAGGSTNYFLWYGIPISPYGNIFASTYVVFTVYAILRYRLMDIRIVARKFIIYLAGAAWAYAMFYAATWFYVAVFGSIYTANTYIFGILAALFFSVGFYFINAQITRIANKYFFAGLYSYQETIKKLSQKLNNTIDLDAIVNLLVDTIKNAMRLDRAGVLLLNKSATPQTYAIARTDGFNEQNGISLVSDNALTRHLLKSQKPLVRDEMDFFINSARTAKERQSYQTLRDNMRHIEASLCLPLISNRELIGIIVLGAKISKDAYSAEDMELLETLSNQAGIAIDNARLYREVRDFNKNLRQKVTEQTKDIVAKAERIEKMAKMRSEFLDIASHQLRTPVSVINGTLSMMMEGDLDGMPEKERRQFINNTYHKGLKLKNIIEDILSASEMDTAVFSLPNTKEANLADIAETVVKERQEEAKRKSLSLVYYTSGKPIPNMQINAQYMEQAITNLVDNAIKYSGTGTIEVGIAPENDSVIITVKDSGIGIPKADLPKLFRKFARARNAKEMYTDGSGLGLFIVKQVAEAHGGTVSVKSAEDEGSTFAITLPVRTKARAFKKSQETALNQ